MNKLINMWKTKKNKITLVLLPSVLIVSNIFLFIPYTIYQGNINEFADPLTSILSCYIFPALALVLLLCTIWFFLPKELSRHYISILFAFGMLIWIQGNLLVWKYGLLDGQAFDWSKDVWRGWVDGALWILLLIMALLFYKKIIKITQVTCIALIFLQLINVVVSSVQNPEIWKAKGKVLLLNTPPKEIMDFSSKQNVIHVVLDAFQSDIFHEIVEEKGGYYKKALDGFTFFKENTGSFPSTYMTIPAMVSGKIYKNDIPMPEFVKSTLNGKTIWNVLYDTGYQVDLIQGSNRYFQGNFSHAYPIPVPYLGNKQQYYRVKSAQMIDLVLFRCAPHFIKRVVYNNQTWLIQRLLMKKVKEKGLYLAPISHKAFFNDFIANMSIHSKQPVYKFIHLVTTHPPPVTNENCEYAGKVLPSNRENYVIQARCGLDDFIHFLFKLKSLNCYDKSLIILQADTGGGLPVPSKKGDQDDFKGQYIERIIGVALPLLAIKLPYSKGPLRISEAQTMLADTPATINSVLNLHEEFPGRSVFDIDSTEVRDRTFYNFKWINQHWQADFLPYLHEYIIKGSVFNGKSWRSARLFPSPEFSFRTERINFGTDEASQFLLAGWGGNGRSIEEGNTYNWALGKSSSVLVGFSQQRPVRLTANIKPHVSKEPQKITIEVDGKVIGCWNVHNRWQWQKHSIIIEPNQHMQDISVIKFIFSHYRKPNENDKERRPLAVLFESITLTELPTYKWGSIIQFGKSGNAQVYQSGGWSVPENGFTWTDGQNASLIITMTTPESSTITLQATFFAFLVPGKVDTQTINILINGKKAGTWVITEPGFQKQALIIPKSLLTNPDWLVITFNTPNAISPSKIGVSDDKRTLGIAVSTIELTS